MAITITVTDEQLMALAGYLAAGSALTAALQLGIPGLVWAGLKSAVGFVWFVIEVIVRWFLYRFQVGALPVAVCRTGFVVVGEKTYYRDPVDLRMYSVVPSTATLVDGAFVLKDYRLIPVEGEAKIAESALYGSEPLSKRSSCPGDYVSIYIERDGEYHYMGAGFREGLFLITAAHTLTDTEGHTLALSRDGSKFFCPAAIKRHYAKEDYARCTGDDVGAFELGPADWAVLGVRSVKPTVYCQASMRRIEIFGRKGCGTLHAGVGALLPADTAQKRLGIVPHSASTVRGFSGSPVYTIGDSSRKIVGLHIAGGSGTDNKNYMASVHEIHFLRKKLGLIPEAELISESPPTETPQYNRHERDDELTEEEARALDDLDRAGKSKIAVGILGFMDDLQGESAPLPEVAPSPEGGSKVATPPPGLEKPDPTQPELLVDPPAEEETKSTPAEQKRIEVLVENGLTAEPEIYVTKPDLEGTAPTPAGKKHVENKKVGNIGRFLGVTAFAGAAIATGGKVFNPDWMVCDGEALRAAKEADYHSMLNSSNFAKYREYMESAHAQAVEETRAMKGVDGTDVARLFADGVSNRSRKKALKRLPTKFLDAVKKVGVDLKSYAGWTNPPAGVEAMEQSLQAHLGSVEATCWPEETRKQFVAKEGPQYQVFLDEVAKYPLNRLRAFADTHSQITRFVMGLDGDKSAGWSQYFRPGTKRSWQDKEGLELASYLTRCRLLLRAAVGPDTMAKMTPSQLVEAGLSDPRTMFIKEEPHNDKKVGEGRWRLIWGASLVDVCTASVTCRKQDKLDIDQFQCGPVEGGHQQAAGLGHHDLGIDRLGVEFDRLIGTGLEVFDADAKNWDMTVNRDSIYADAWRRTILYDGPYRDVFEMLALCEAAANSAHVVLVGGNLWEILKPGITASGILSTTAQNSFIRALLYALIGIRHCIVAGDDAAAARKPGWDHVAELRKYGPIEKAVNLYDSSKGLEFTSHQFKKQPDGSWVGRFLNLGKACARLAMGQQVRPDQLAGLLFCVRHDEGSTRDLAALSKEMDWPIAGVEPACLPYHD